MKYVKELRKNIALAFFRGFVVRKPRLSQRDDSYEIGDLCSLQACSPERAATAVVEDERTIYIGVRVSAPSGFGGTVMSTEQQSAPDARSYNRARFGDSPEVGGAERRR